MGDKSSRYTSCTILLLLLCAEERVGERENECDGCIYIHLRRTRIYMCVCRPFDDRHYTGCGGGTTVAHNIITCTESLCARP